jgi:hypothetical protein
MPTRTLREKLRVIRKARLAGAIDTSECFVQMSLALQDAGRFLWSRPRRFESGETFSSRPGDRFVNYGNDGVQFIRDVDLVEIA